MLKQQIEGEQGHPQLAIDHLRDMLKEEVIRLATDEGLRGELGFRLYRYLTEVVSWEIVAGQYFQAYEMANAETRDGVPVDIPPEF